MQEGYFLIIICDFPLPGIETGMKIMNKATVNYVNKKNLNCDFVNYYSCH